MLGRLLGRKAEKPTTANDQIQKLGDSIDVLNKREAVLIKKIDFELAKAREASQKGNKQTALLHLKRKKQFEDQLTKIQAQRSNIEQMQLKLEEVAMNMESLQAQRQGAQAIRNLYGRMTPERIDKEMDDVRNVMESATEISEAISQPLGTDLIDEDELEAELAELEQEELDKELLALDHKTTVPTNPIGPAKAKPAAVAADEDEEVLRQLEAELNG
eukprot:NODE_5730_length_976_cov_44.944900_g5149_i0.p1 GENE.NODE_5730_length_976_cov_44.944900_g5149_i0~~NODE_5730_length_976_cov_44.944900_g5149_i0.p1  ORF type:complete len:217 (-),score=54.32 NODE_5730_length_976_cov_44.944900_g5149_i0:260-910(-)